MSFLGNLSSSSKPRVYLSVNPEVGLEMIQLDLATNSVANYAVRDLTYNELKRDIADYDEFKAAVQDMFAELNVNPKCEVILNMPLVSLGLNSYPLLLNDASITGAIESELIQSYVFQKDDPEIAWQDIPMASGQTDGDGTRKIVYAAIQKSVINNIGEALASIGASLIGVDNSLSATLRALDYAGYAETQMQPNMTWNLLIVNASGYSIVSLSGKNIIDYYEEPLAVKSFEGDEIYNAINQSAQIALMSSPANYLFILSDTDQVSASLLASKLQTQSTVTVLENNSFKKEPLISVGLNVLQTYATKISLQAIGTALADVSEYPIKLQFPGTAVESVEEATCTIVVGEKEIILNQTRGLQFAALIGFAVLIPVLLLSFLIMPNLLAANQEKLDKVNADIKTIDAEIAKYKEAQGSTVFNVKTEIEKGVKGNRSKLMNYIAAGEAIPKTVWLTYFMTQGDGLVDIKGVASNIEDVNVFFRNMQDSLIGTKLRLQNLDLVSRSVEDAISGGGANSNYSFEITNMTTDQLNALLNIAQPENGENPQQAQGGKPQQNQQQQPQNGGATPPQSGLLSQQPIQGN